MNFAQFFLIFFFFYFSLHYFLVYTTNQLVALKSFSPSDHYSRELTSTYQSHFGLSPPAFSSLSTIFKNPQNRKAVSWKILQLYEITNSFQSF